METGGGHAVARLLYVTIYQYHPVSIMVTIKNLIPDYSSIYNSYLSIKKKNDITRYSYKCCTTLSDMFRPSRIFVHRTTVHIRTLDICYKPQPGSMEPTRRIFTLRLGIWPATVPHGCVLGPQNPNQFLRHRICRRELLLAR